MKKRHPSLCSKKTLGWACLIILCFVHPACGNKGGTETGTTDPGLGVRIEATASALMPRIDDSSFTESSSSLKAALTLGSEEEWSVFLEPDRSYLLTDIFGDVDSSGPTRIRNLLRRFQGNITSVLSTDPNLDCSGSSLLESSDSISIAFYGALGNGSADNRRFRCLSIGSGDDSDDRYVTVYGRDNDGIINMVWMYDIRGVADQFGDNRGNSSRDRSVMAATYTEVSENGQTVAHLDLQSAHATNYIGLDDIFQSEDDFFFKTRSRITGRVFLDSSGNAGLAAGDFAVTKYDLTIPEEWGLTEHMTTTTGRISENENKYALFRIQTGELTNRSALLTFCLTLPDDASQLPSTAGENACLDFGESYAWGDAVFPFELLPAPDEVFDNHAFFGASDLITNSADNFSIPDYN